MDTLMRRPRPLAYLLTIMIMLSMVLVACGGGDDEGDTDDATVASASASPTTQAPPANASPTATDRAGSGQVSGASPTAQASPTARGTETAEAQAEVSPTVRPRGTAPIRPIATRQPEPTQPSQGGQVSDGDLTVVQQGFSQIEEYDEVSWGMIVENTDTENAIVDTTYVVEIYDADDALLETEESYIDFVMPGSRQGIGGTIYLPDGTVGERMEVSIQVGTAEPPPLNPEFTFGPVSYFEESLFPVATAALTVSSEFALQDIEVTAIGYDAAGEIIGGGYSYLSFLYPGQPIGVEVGLSSAEAPAEIELFPTITSSTVFAAAGETPGGGGAQLLDVQQQGWGESSTYPGEVGWGFVVVNPNTGLAAETVSFQATAYAADGTVLTTSGSYVSMVLPGETMGVGGTMYLPDGATQPIDRVDIQLFPSGFTETSLTPGFLRTLDVTYVDDEFSPKVTGIVSNELSVELEQVEVYAVAYNEAGEIIGGGWAFVELVPAGSENASGQAAAEVFVATAGDPARVEMYATVSSATALE